MTSKQAINELVHDRFSVAETKLNGNGVEVEQPVPSVESSEPHTNGFHKSKAKSESSAASPSQRSSPLKREASSEEDMSDVIDNAPPKKKRKAGVEDDASLAARLQFEENQGARPTRGAATRKTQPSKKKKRTPKKKSKARVDGSTDSELDDGEPKKPKSNTGFHVSAERALVSHVW